MELSWDREDWLGGLVSILSLEVIKCNSIWRLWSGRHAENRLELVRPAKMQCYMTSALTVRTSSPVPLFGLLPHISKYWAGGKDSYWESLFYPLFFLIGAGTANRLVTTTIFSFFKERLVKTECILLPSQFIVAPLNVWDLTFNLPLTGATQWKYD